MSDPICPGRTAAGKLLGREEAAAGVFSPGYAHPVPTDMRRRPCFRCWALPDACLEVLPTRLTSKGAYDDPRSNVIGVKLYPINSRPFRLHVAGLTHAELRTRLDRLKTFVMDPLKSELLRHLESDFFGLTAPVPACAGHSTLRVGRAMPLAMQALQGVTTSSS